jgi:UDP-glucose 4-epimerase
MEVAAGFATTSLRYFNVVGSGEPDLYDASPHNLFPLVFEALLAGRVPRINGDDYDTPDGTCVRDYIHVADLAHSHAVAAQKLEAGEQLERAYNLGSGDGVSVRQIMDAMASGTGIAFEPEVAPRRPGDPARIVATGEAAARDLDWAMRHSLDEMVSSAWEARRRVG